MNTNIKTTAITMTDAISEYVARRLEKITKIIGEDPSIQCDIELARTTSHHNKGDIFKAEIHIVGANRNLYASSEKEDLYSAIDVVQDEILRELKTDKEKKLSMIRKGGARMKSMMKGLWPWK
jgi:ribosomal subunit interface protein